MLIALVALAGCIPPQPDLRAISVTAKTTVGGQFMAVHGVTVVLGEATVMTDEWGLATFLVRTPSFVTLWATHPDYYPATLTYFVTPESASIPLVLVPKL